MGSINRVRSALVVCATAVFACGDGSDAPTTVQKKAASGRMNASMGALHESAAAEKQDGSKREGGVATDGGALAFVPKEALFALRSPSVGGLAAAVASSEVAKGLACAGIVDVGVGAKSLLAKAREAIRVEDPSVLPLFDLLVATDGEVAFAVLGVDPMAAMSNGPMPFTVAAFIEVGAHAGEVVAAIDGLTGKKPSGTTVSKLGPGHYRVSDSEMQLEVGTHDQWLVALLAPGSGEPPCIDDLFQMDSGRSFLASDVRRMAQDAGAVTSSASIEAFVNLGPLWALAKAAGPGDLSMAFDMLDLDALRGLCASLAFDAAGRTDDRFALVSPGRRDVLTSLFDPKAFDPAFARFTPADADDAGVIAFDLERAWRTVRGRIPAEARAEIDAGLERIKLDEGIDLEQDVIAAFGPNVATATRGSWIPSERGAADFEAVVAIEVRSATRANHLFDVVREQFPLPLEPRSIAGSKAFTVTMPFPEAPPWLEPTFVLRDDALVVATSPKALEKSLTAAQTAGAKNPRFAAAIAARPGDAFSVAWVDTGKSIASMLDAMLESVGNQPPDRMVPSEILAALPTRDQMREFAKELSESVRYWRANDRGLSFESHGPISVPAAAIAGISIVSAIAIPNLLSARSSANETAAIAMLRNLVSAEAQFQAVGCADRDADGIGEYGGLAEMSGMALLPSGEWLDPPVLSKKCGILVDGCLQRNGYNFRIFLPDRGMTAIPERPEGGIPPEVDVNNAEVFFAAVAWPIQPGQTGLRAFYVTQEGVVRSTPFESIAHARRGAAEVFVSKLLWPATSPDEADVVEGTLGESWTSVR